MNLKKAGVQFTRDLSHNRVIHPAVSSVLHQLRWYHWWSIPRSTATPFPHPRLCHFPLISACLFAACVSDWLLLLFFWWSSFFGLWNITSFSVLQPRVPLFLPFLPDPWSLPMTMFVFVLQILDLENVVFDGWGFLTKCCMSVTNAVQWFLFMADVLQCQ